VGTSTSPPPRTSSSISAPLVRERYDAVVVGAGPNGLAAAIRLAQAGWEVLLVEGAPTVGGGTRSAERTVPGFVHDVCSAIHPLAAGSPFFATLPLADHGLAWVQPDAPLAHPLDDGPAVVLERSVEATGQGLGVDAAAWRVLFAPLVQGWPALRDQLLGPPRLPRHPLALARFSWYAARSARGVAAGRFDGPRARALFAGLAAHSFLPLDRPLTAAFGLLLGVTGHAVGWPFARGGSQAIADALASYARSLGVDIATDAPVQDLAELPRARAVLLDVTPRQLLRIAGDRLPPGARRRFSSFRYGLGVYKVDYALDAPVPWKAEGAGRAATLHLGGTLEEIVAGEGEVAAGRHPERPYVLVAQQAGFDASRAPRGKHTLWAYCHVPNGSTVDMAPAIEAQIERFAPGFRDRVLARATMSAVDYERYNPNNVGGDIGGGANDGLQILARPQLTARPYATGARGVYLCSASTPPGGGVHGMCGFFAAEAVLRDARGGALSAGD
jgi:phytoene dehydrogenase-like protein